MSFVKSARLDKIAILSLDRGRVNAVNQPFIDEMSETLESLRGDNSVGGIIITGRGPFFSFGFDVPEMLGIEKPECEMFVTSFTNLLTEMFLYPKPVVAALNGHTVAGGCMLAMACDQRVMVSPGKWKMSLNEITFGATVFAGAAAMLRYAVGGSNAQQILYSGAMYSAEEAKAMGMVDRLAAESELMDRAIDMVSEMAEKDGAAFASVKRLIRQPVSDEARRREANAIKEFVEIWYSDSTWSKLQNITIRP